MKLKITIETAFSMSAWLLFNAN